jgi:hypothetical protein
VGTAFFAVGAFFGDDVFFVAIVLRLNFT